MKWHWPPDAALRREARVFGLGAGTGFVAGLLFVSLALWASGGLTGSRAATFRDPVSMIPPVERAEDAVGTAGSGTAPPVGHEPIPAVTPPASPEPAISASPGSVGELADRDLLIPVEGIQPEQLVRTFDEQRGSSRRHEAIDILAPRNTPVRAVEEGRIAKLFASKAGGITIYQFDPTEQFCYYYAHLERYADGLREGEVVKKGQIIGYVGVSGNAPKNTPHLHFAVFRLTSAKRWWEGTPIDPYDVLRY